MVCFSRIQHRMEQGGAPIAPSCMSGFRLDDLAFELSQFRLEWFFDLGLVIRSKREIKVVMTMVVGSNRERQ